jgi:hypothetical protein
MSTMGDVESISHTVPASIYLAGVDQRHILGLATEHTEVTEPHPTPLKRTVLNALLTAESKPCKDNKTMNWGGVGWLCVLCALCG